MPSAPGKLGVLAKKERRKERERRRGEEEEEEEKTVIRVQSHSCSYRTQL